MFFRSIVNTQKEGGVCKGGMYVKRSHMGISFNCGRPMSTTAFRSILFLAGSCSLYELNVGALCCSEHSLLLSSSSVCQRALARGPASALATAGTHATLLMQQGWRGGEALGG